MGNRTTVDVRVPGGWANELLMRQGLYLSGGEDRRCQPSRAGTAPCVISADDLG